MKRIIIFLIRKRLGLKKEQPFIFTNQRLKEEYYYFTEDALMKHTVHGNNIWSDVSLKWLLDDKCKCEIEKVPADIVLKYHYRTIQPGEIERRLENNEHTI